MSDHSKELLGNFGSYLAWLPSEGNEKCLPFYLPPDGGANDEWFDKTYTEFTELQHATHWSSTIDIIESGRLTPKVIKESMLEGKEGVWLAGVDRPGQRYGPILLKFPFSLLNNCFYYWVEVFDYASSESSSRILVTKNERRDLRRYDPNTSQYGPWVIREGKHYALKETSAYGNAGEPLRFAANLI